MRARLIHKTAEVVAVGEGGCTLRRTHRPSCKSRITFWLESHAGIEVKDGEETYTIVGTANILANCRVREERGKRNGERY